MPWGCSDRCHAGADRSSRSPACLGKGYAELGFRGDGSCAAARAAPVLHEDPLRGVQEALALQRCCSQHRHLCPELSHCLHAWRAVRTRMPRFMTAQPAARCQEYPGTAVNAALASTWALPNELEWLTVPTSCGTCVFFASSAAMDCSRMSLVLMMVSAAAELPCCAEGHRKRQPAAKSAMPCHLGAELGCDRPRTKCTLSCAGSAEAIAVSAAALGLQAVLRVSCADLASSCAQTCSRHRKAYILLTARAHLQGRKLQAALGWGATHVIAQAC